MLRPQVLVSEKDFLVVYKPPRMHSAPLARSPSNNLLTWCTGKFPETASLSGRRAGEGGLLHRLDFETNGLLLVARTSRGMDALLEQQKNERIIKEYSVLASVTKTVLPGFPCEKPDFFSGSVSGIVPIRIESAFRPYGFGRKAVRPVMVHDGGKPYITEILELRPLSHGITSFRLRIYKGFRHQIRSHLAWIGRPILNDDIYGAVSFGKGFLALRACSISFNDPSSDINRTYSIPCLGLDDI